MKHYIDWCFINAGWNSKKPRFTQDAYDKIYSITQGFMLPLSQFYKNTLSECTLKGKTKFTHEDVEEILNQLDIPKIHVSENVSKDQTKSFDIDFNSINVLYKEKNNSSIEQDVRVPILEKSNKDFKFDEDIISLKKENINQNISVEETIKDDIIKRMERIFLIMQEQDDKLQNLTNDALNKLSTLRIKNNQMPIFMSDNL
jgi:hypothetical protein